MSLNEIDASINESGARKFYAAPKLEVFGEVAALTAGGSSGSLEGNATSNRNKRSG